MEPRWERVRAPEARRAWTEVLRPLAAETARGARELSDHVVAHIRERLPDLFPDPESAEENRASIEASIRAVDELIEQGGDPSVITLPPVVIAYAEAGVRRGIPLSSLLRSYRIGHEVVWDVTFSHIVERSGDTAQLAVAAELCSAWMFAYVDAAATLVERFYVAERDRWLRSAAASRADTLDAILTGRQRDVHRASVQMQYQLARNHVGVVVWIDAAPEGANPLASLEAAIASFAVAAKAERPLVHPLGLLAVAAWLSRTAPFGPDELDALRLDPRASPGVRAAFGEPGAGLAGFALSHVEAGHARRVATIAGRPPGTTVRYGQVALSAMATVDPDQARVFIERQLGPLAAGDDVALRLAATVATYLDEHASRSRTARRLGIHENTVSYRVRQAEELLGRSVEERTLDLRVALALAGVVGSDPAALKPEVRVSKDFAAGG